MESISRIHLIITAGFFLLPVYLPLPVLAHRLAIHPGENNIVIVSYDDGARAASAKVRLYDSDGNEFGSGFTNESGEFHPGARSRPYRITVDDGMGHNAVWIEGHINAVHAVPLRTGVLLGLGVFMFIGAFFYYRGSLKPGDNKHD